MGTVTWARHGWFMASITLGSALVIGVEHGPAGSAVHLRGDLDSSTVAQLRTVASDLPAGADVVIDLSRVPFIDSAGIGALIGVIRQVHEGNGTARLHCPSAYQRRLLARTGVDRLAPVIDGARHR